MKIQLGIVKKNNMNPIFIKSELLKKGKIILKKDC